MNIWQLLCQAWRVCDDCWVILDLSELPFEWFSVCLASCCQTDREVFSKVGEGPTLENAPFPKCPCTVCSIITPGSHINRTFAAITAALTEIKAGGSSSGWGSSSSTTSAFFVNPPVPLQGLGVTRTEQDTWSFGTLHTSIELNKIKKEMIEYN